MFVVAIKGKNEEWSHIMPNIFWPDYTSVFAFEMYVGRHFLHHEVTIDYVKETRIPDSKI